MGHPMMGGMGGMGGHPMMGGMGMMGDPPVMVTLGGPISAGLVGVPVGTTVMMPQSQAIALNAKAKSLKKAGAGAKGKSMGTLTLYHITDKAAAKAIKKSGKMLRGSQGAYGAGIYFAESPKACMGKAHNHGWLIKARVKMGKAKVVSQTGDHSHSELKKAGFDSVYAPTGPRGGDAEYVVFNHSQVTVVSVEKYHG